MWWIPALPAQHGCEQTADRSADSCFSTRFCTVCRLQEGLLFKVCDQVGKLVFPSNVGPHWDIKYVSSVLSNCDLKEWAFFQPRPPADSTSNHRQKFGTVESQEDPDARFFWSVGLNESNNKLLTEQTQVDDKVCSFLYQPALLWWWGRRVNPRVTLAHHLSPPTAGMPFTLFTVFCSFKRLHQIWFSCEWKPCYTKENSQKATWWFQSEDFLCSCKTSTDLITS